MRRRFGLLCTVALAGAALACGTPREPIRAVSKAELAVHEADNGAAPERAPQELQMARDKLARAERALHDGHHSEARRLAEEAVVDAELADAKAESAESRASVEAAQEMLHSLHGETGREVRERIRGVDGGTP